MNNGRPIVLRFHHVVETPPVRGISPLYRSSTEEVRGGAQEHTINWQRTPIIISRKCERQKIMWGLHYDYQTPVQISPCTARAVFLPTFSAVVTEVYTSSM